MWVNSLYYFSQTEIFNENIEIKMAVIDRHSSDIKMFPLFFFKYETITMKII